MTNRIGPSFSPRAYIPSSLPGRTLAIAAVALAVIAALVFVRRASHWFFPPAAHIGQKQAVPQGVALTLDRCELSRSPFNKMFALHNVSTSDDRVLIISHISPDLGLGYVADTPGYNNAELRYKLEQILQSFRENVGLYLYSTKQKEELQNTLLDLVLKLGQVYQTNAGSSSTITLAKLSKMGERRFVTVVHVGNSSLFHIDSQQKISTLTQPTLACLGLAKKEDFFVATYEVQKGDKIIGVSSGITKALKGSEFNGILLESNVRDFEAVLANKLDEKIKANPSLKDDVAFFQMVVE